MDHKFPRTQFEVPKSPAPTLCESDDDDVQYMGTTLPDQPTTPPQIGFGHRNNFGAQMPYLLATPPLSPMELQSVPGAIMPTARSVLSANYNQPLGCLMPAQCFICNRTFTDDEKLRQHIKSHARDIMSTNLAYLTVPPETFGENLWRNARMPASTLTAPVVTPKFLTPPFPIAPATFGENIWRNATKPASTLTAPVVTAPFPTPPVAISPATVGENLCRNTTMTASTLTAPVVIAPFLTPPYPIAPVTFGENLRRSATMPASTLTAPVVTASFLTPPVASAPARESSNDNRLYSCYYCGSMFVYRDALDAHQPQCRYRNKNATKPTSTSTAAVVTDPVDTAPVVTPPVAIPPATVGENLCRNTTTTASTLTAPVVTASLGSPSIAIAPVAPPKKDIDMLSCYFCSKKFSYAAALGTHQWRCGSKPSNNINAKPTQKNLKCRFCKKRYIRESFRQRHEQTKHGNEQPVPPPATQQPRSATPPRPLTLIPVPMPVPIPPRSGDMKPQEIKMYTTRTLNAIAAANYNPAKETAAKYIVPTAGGEEQLDDNGIQVPPKQKYPLRSAYFNPNLLNLEYDYA